jgi:hypothetical protein
MSVNISKYLVLNPFLLLEVEFNKDGVQTDLKDGGITPMYALVNDTKQYYNRGDIGTINNDLLLNSVPTDTKRSTWYTNYNDSSAYYTFFDASIDIDQDFYKHDKIKVHIVAGYNFDEVGGFLLQVRAMDTSNNMVDLSNFTWIKQVVGSDVLKFSSEPLYLGNRFYDKYTELLVPSVQELGGKTGENIEKALKIKLLSDVYITYSTITEVDNHLFNISEAVNVQLPVTSSADNFNCFISESVVGDYIEYYAIWNNEIIGEYIGDIESGRIALYTSNNPNDNFEEFVEIYGTSAAKWVLIHELQVYEHIPPTTTLLTQRFQFTQDGNFLTSNKFRPTIINADIASSYTIDYICRLMNRMDGSQIIRKASFSSTNPKKYGLKFDRINVDNFIPYKIFNRVSGEKANIIQGSNLIKTQYSKIFYDTTNVLLDVNNVVMPQGTGLLFLKRGDSTYKFKFERLNQDTTPSQLENVDLSGVYNYTLLFVLDNGLKIEVYPTYSNNMNTTLGELEFKLKREQTRTLLEQINNTYSIIIKNPDGTQYTFYEGLFYSNKDYSKIVAKYRVIFDISNKISDLEAQVTALTNENENLKAALSGTEIPPQIGKPSGNVEYT